MSRATTASEGLFDTLRSLAFFRDAGDQEIRELAKLAKTTDFDAGTVIFTECEPATHCYLIVEGSVLVEICGPDKCTTILTIGPGELLGWSTLLGAARLTATARCLEATRTIELVGSEVLALCEQDPKLGYCFMKCVAKTLSKRLTATRLQLLDLFQAEGGQ